VNTDELLAQIEADEAADRADVQTVMAPVDYARARGIKPQMVYYYLRTGKLTSSHCECGRRVIDIQEADDIFRKGRDDVQDSGTAAQVSDTQDLPSGLD
jgi:hypothetical protein